jgi:protease-4
VRNSRFRRGISRFFGILDGIRRVFGGLVVLAVLVIVVVALVPPRPPRLKPDSLLEIRPYGRLVDAYTEPVSYRGWPVGEAPAETLLDDLIRTVDYAAADDRIVAAWLDLEYFEGGGLANLSELADALEGFRNSGKTLLASADTYDGDRFYLAATADTVVLDRLGEVFPSGYGLYRAYLAEGLDRLGARAHLFRSGDSKSAGETFTRDAMSEQSRRDEERLLGDLWTSWLTRVAAFRGVDPTFLENWIDGYADAVASADNNAARAARKAGLIDLVDTGDVLRKRLNDLVEDDPARRIADFDYLWAVDEVTLRGPAVAVVPVRGVMVYGEGRTGEAGSDDVIARIEAARDDPSVEALVVRIDSVGGDVRAAEAIRRALERTRNDWKIPVVAS